MKTVKVVAAVIVQYGKVFATQRATANLKTDGNSPAVKLKRERRRSRLWFGKYRKNWIRKWMLGIYWEL